MKSHLLRLRSIHKGIFDVIESGKKKVETRAATPKYKKIKENDELVFWCGAQKCKKKVIRIRYFKSLAGLLKTYKPSEINPAVKTPDELRTMYYSFPGYKEKIKKYGLVAFEL